MWIYVRNGLIAAAVAVGIVYVWGLLQMATVENPFTPA